MDAKRVSFVRTKNGKIKAKFDKNGRWIIISPPIVISGLKIGYPDGIGFDPIHPTQQP